MKTTSLENELVESRAGRVSSQPETLDLASIGQTWTPPQTANMTPEVSDLLQEMPWWVARGLIYVIVSFLVVATAWAWFSVVDVIVQARGALVPEGYVRPTQTVVGGTVQYVFVREGETVKRGQPLVQLDGTEMRARLKKLREELQTSREQLRQRLATQGPVADALDQQNRLARLESEVATTELNLRQTTIMATSDGVITALEVRHVGTVLAAGQTVATIAPAGTRLVIEAQVNNQDIALIEPGLMTKLKFDAFPFQDYGIVTGRVLAVAPDAQVSQGRPASYKVTILPEQTSLKAQGKLISLRPGLNAGVEIVTERRTILSFVLEPFRKLRA